MSKRVHWSHKGLYTVCGFGGYAQLAETEEKVTCPNCLYALPMHREEKAEIQQRMQREGITSQDIAETMPPRQGTS